MTQAANLSALVFVVATAVSIIGYMAYVTIRLGRLQRALGFRDQLIDRLQNDMQALTAGAAGLSENLANIELALRRIDERQTQNELRDTATHSYDYAMRLARSGASVKQLEEQCGLIKDEAKLLVQMYGMEKAS